MLKAIRLSRGDDAPELAEYVPGGNMEQMKAPLATQLSVLEPYMARFAAVPEDLIPAAVKAEVAQAFDEARQALAAAEARDRADAEARKAREAIEPEWNAAYGDYHRGVEYQMQNDVVRIEKPASSSSSAGAGASSSGASSGSSDASSAASG